VVVVVDEPRAGAYYGGEVAAPVFSRIVEGAMRILAIPPDDVRRVQSRPAIAVTTAANVP
jgi:cell division protein FtsI (penicillin-binding protein 3)